MIDNAGPVLTFLEDRRREIVDFACELIGTPSPNPPGDERGAARLLTDLFAEFGLEAETVARDPRRPNVLLRLPGKADGRRLLFNGHIDTKPPGDLGEWRIVPFTPAV